MYFVAHSHTPHDCYVRFASAVTDGRATLTARRPATALPGPDFHRLDRASLAWRTGPNTRAGSIRSAVRQSHSAKVRPVQSVCPECTWLAIGVRRHHRSDRDHGSCNPEQSPKEKPQ